jgi:hypothetical protein
MIGAELIAVSACFIGSPVDSPVDQSGTTWPLLAPTIATFEPEEVVTPLVPEAIDGPGLRGDRNLLKTGRSPPDIREGLSFERM